MRIHKKILIILIEAYQLWISPLLPSSCKFIPHCSDYTQEAINSHGANKGIRLGLQRLLKCHPFHEGGFDPVPPQS